MLLERGRPSRYHLVQQHVAAAVAAGGSLDECRRLLTRLTQGRLPDAVEERLATWRERFGALSIRPAVVLKSRTSNELDAVLDDGPPVGKPVVTAGAAELFGAETGFSK